MLALCLACALGAGGLRGQTFTPVPYNFQMVPESAPTNYTDGGFNYAETVNSMAANGYGLWLAGSYGAYSYAWRLAGNGLAQENTTAYPLIPNGTLAYGNDNQGLDGAQDTKVATNLRGSVRYVCVGSDEYATDDEFIISGLDDAQCGGTPHQISLNMPYSATNNLFNNQYRRSAINGSEYSYGVASTGVKNEIGEEPPPYIDYEVLGGGSETPIDWDIAMDGHFLYIVWHHYEFNDLGYEIYTGDEIFVTCVDLATGTTQNGFPIILHNRRLSEPSAQGVGTQPTIACDVRNNSTGTSFTPDCDIAYIDGNGTVRHIGISGSTANLFEPLPTIAMEPWDPMDQGSAYYPHPYNLVALPSPALRARIVVASSGSSMQNHVIGYFVIASQETALYFFNEVDGVFGPGSGSHYGWYVDGPIEPAHNPAWLPEAKPIGGFGQVVQVPSNQIVAFANPYDGQNNGYYDEFHCVYTVSSIPGVGLMILRGADNGMPWPSSPIPYQTDTRTAVNQANGVLPLLGTSDYCAAVNQAGIHVRWDDGTYSYYKRDRRSYDEPIEENTILSYDNYIADGSSTGANHGGTVGAQTQPGKNVLAWTDPILFNQTPAAGDYATINFGNAPVLGNPITNANAAGLTIGTTSAADAATKLTMFPNFQCTFQSPPLNSNRNFIQIDRSGTCDYYAGSIYNGSVNEIQNNFVAGGDFNLNSNGATTGILATLNIMPGCNFRMVDDGNGGIPRLIAKNVDCNINALTGTGEDLLPQDNGTITLYGSIQCTHSSITCSAMPATPLVYLINIYGVATSPTSYVNYSTITDNAPGGQELVNLQDPLSEFQFEQNTCSGVCLNGYFEDHEADIPIPSRPLIVINCSFDKIFQQGIHLGSANVGAIADYNITLDNNTFNNYLAAGSDGILLEDFRTNIPGDITDYGTPIDISDNTFTTASIFGTIHPYDTSHVQAAIHLRNSSAVVDGNTIKGKRSDGTSTYAYGIWQDLSSVPDNTVIANTLICSNIISYVGYAPSGGIETGGGISTTFWQGYEKLNDISHSAQGSIFGANNAGKYLVDDIHDNSGPGINNIADYSTSPLLEMRGLIHPGNAGDGGGYNVIWNNNQDHSSSSGEVVVANGVTLHIGNENGTGSPSITYGQNSLIENTNTDKMIFGPTTTGYSCMIGSDVSTPDNCLNANYYQRVVGTPYTPTGTSTPTLDAAFGGNVNYNSTTGTVSILPDSLTNPGVVCYSTGNGQLTKKGSVRPTSSATDTLSLDECSQLKNKAGELTGVADSEAYDTVKAYLTLCYNQQYSDGMFSIAGADVDGMGSGLSKYDDFREWLKSVLYLRMDSAWYCADVYQILRSFHYYPGHGTYLNAMEAVTRYILENNRCDSEWTAMFAQGITWPSAIEYWWSDTVRDSLTEPRPDTTVPSIDSIGLSILRGPQFAGVAPSPIASGEDNISGLYVTENPFTNTTAIKFTLGDYGLVTFQLFDVLGHAVTTNGIGQVLYPGAHEFDIDGSKLPPGSYIARIAFHDEDAKSIMVVRK